MPARKRIPPARRYRKVTALLWPRLPGNRRTNHLPWSPLPAPPPIRGDSGLATERVGPIDRVRLHVHPCRNRPAPLPEPATRRIGMPRVGRVGRSGATMRASRTTARAPTTTPQIASQALHLSCLLVASPSRRRAVSVALHARAAMHHASRHPLDLPRTPTPSRAHGIARHGEADATRQAMTTALRWVAPFIPPSRQACARIASRPRERRFWPSLHLGGPPASNESQEPP